MDTLEVVGNLGEVLKHDTFLYMRIFNFGYRKLHFSSRTLHARAALKH